MTQLLNPLIHAQIVYEGGALTVPPQMGAPGATQLLGTSEENLAELAGRVCYDSLGGNGRASREYHQHIIDVQHLSVYEHVSFTVEIGPADDVWLSGGEFDVCQLLPNFINRPSLFVRLVPPRALRVTLNVRHILEWAKWFDSVEPLPQHATDILRGLAIVMAESCPAIFSVANGISGQIAWLAGRPTVATSIPLPRIKVQRVAPVTADEIWISLFLSGSRGFSHEQVRHGDWTGISQRSTRFVDESSSPWVEHPLITQFHESGAGRLGFPKDSLGSLEHDAREVYAEAVRALQPWLVARGVDTFTARKQARGAARGYLGNALYTEMIFSANVAQWRRMILARASGGADAEIREVFCKALACLQTSAHASFFADLALSPSPDGIGQIGVSVSA